MFHNIFKNWNFVRLLRLAIGIFLTVESCKIRNVVSDNHRIGFCSHAIAEYWMLFRRKLFGFPKKS